MIVSMNDEKIVGEDLNKLLNFCFLHSDRVTLTTECQTTLSEEEITAIIENHKEISRSKNLKYKEDYDTNRDNYRDRLHRTLKYLDNSKEKAYEYFDGLLEQELEMIPMIKDGFYEDQKRKDIIEKVSYNFDNLPLIEIQVTNHTPVTIGPIVNLCFFECDERMRSEFSKMSDLFSPIEIGYARMDDMVFFDGDRVFFSVCSHEGYANFNFTDEEFQEFMKLGLAHDIPSEHW